MVTKSQTPAKIDLTDRSRIEIVWDDGHVSSWSPLELRRQCYCAHCNEFRRAGEQVFPRPGGAEAISVSEGRLVGAYGITFIWSDGHEYGIYRWDLLRSWCTCDECMAEDETS